MEEVIKEVYQSNSGTAYEVYKEAVKKDNSTRLQDVKDYLNSRQDKQTHFKYKKYNSFVSPGANFEYEVDIMDLGTSVTEFRYGFVAVDNFTKMASVIPIENKQTDEIIRALKKVIETLGKPKQLYSDEEGAFNSTKYIRFINEQNIKHIQTTTHAHTAERYIQTFRMNLQRRLDALDQVKSDWVKHVSGILTKYSNTENSTIQIKPVDAVKKENHLCVNWHLQTNAKKYKKKYPKIEPSNYVRIKINQKKTAKGNDPTFTKEKYKVSAIKDNEYYIPSYHKQRLWMRHELLLV